MTGRTLDVALVGRAKHDILWLAACKLGGQSELAKALSMSPGVVGQWVNLVGVPSLRLMASRTFQQKILGLTGKLVEDIWPEDLRQAILARRRKSLKSVTFVVTRPVEIAALLPVGREALALPAPQNFDADSLLMDKERVSLVQHVLDEVLTKIQAETIRMRFGLFPYDREHTLQEVADLQGVSREAVRRSSEGALERLRGHIAIAGRGSSGRQGKLAETRKLRELI